VTEAQIPVAVFLLARYKHRRLLRPLNSTMVWLPQQISHLPNHQPQQQQHNNNNNNNNQRFTAAWRTRPGTDATRTTINNMRK
jgi:beta-lactamase regulating signal transducer with metallopeptidase domain